MIIVNNEEQAYKSGLTAGDLVDERRDIPRFSYIDQKNFMVVVNGTMIPDYRNYSIKDNDEILILPMYIGG